MHSFESLITNVPDFPKPGVIFKDINPLLAQRFMDVVSEMSRGFNWEDIDLVLGIESRGFILGAGIAAAQKKGFLPVRKKGKLPPPVLQESYELEYGTDILEMSPNLVPKRVLIIDDVLATGGTLKAVMNLCEKNMYKVQGISVLINLTFLNKFKENQNLNLSSVLEY